VPLQQYAAVELFVQRAQAARPEFALTEENAAAVAEICVRLDGLPLAIELAAARIRLLPPQALLARMVGAPAAGIPGRPHGSSLQLLTGGARDLPARQQSLRNTIAWSYDLLDEREKRLFHRLSVFVGGCTLADVEAVCEAGGDLEADLLDGMASLVEKSLLQQEEPGTSSARRQEGEPRFRMLDTIREYGLEVLAASGEEEAIRRRHAEHFLALAEAAGPALGGPDAALWRDHLAAEHDNLRAALAWSAESGTGEAGSPGDPTTSARILQGSRKDRSL
jgi:predicted ATPase